MHLNIQKVHTSNHFILNEKELKFFFKFQNESIPDLLLQNSFSEKEKQILKQIAQRQKIKNKIPTWYQQIQIHYPPSISLEQASSEATANYKATLVKGKILIDATAGMGIDAFFIGQKFQRTILIEQNKELAHITSHNLSLFEKTQHYEIASSISIETFCQDFTEKVDCIYLDPARRDAQNKKIISLKQCQPNIISLLPNLWNMTDFVLLKTSPMLDIHKAINELKNVAEVHILEWNGECRELLFLIKKECTMDPKIHIVQLDTGTNISFYLFEEKNATCHYELPQKYLYEPSVSAFKSGAFKWISQNYNVAKLHPNTHLYTSLQPIYGFPGKRYIIEKILKPHVKEISKYVPEQKAILKIRNFPEKVETLRKKWKLKQGNNYSIFATTNRNNERIILLSRID